MAKARVVPDCCPQCGASLPAGEGERLTCAYCGSSLLRLQAAGEQGAGKSKPGGAWGVRLRKVAYVDQQGIGCEAFHMLIPADWAFEGGVHWLMNNPGMPAVIAFRASNPQGAEAFEVFPNLSFYWTNNPMITMMFPPGSTYFGSEVRPPAPALQVMQEIVVPRFRGQMPGLQVVGQEHLPDLAQALRAGSPVDSSGVTGADGARVRVRYRHGEHELEEDVFGVVEVTQINMPTAMGVMQIIFWLADYLFSFRAPAGQLEDLSGTFNAVARSFRLNPQWYARYVQVGQYLIQNQIQHIQNIGQISRIVSQTSSQISDMMMESYNQRQQTMDRISDQFSQAIRGVDAYYDPLGQQSVELPGGYENAWSNALGEYIVTNDPNFNPNIGSNQNWEAMKRQP